MDKQQKRTLAIVFFTVFLDLVGFGIILPLTPYLAKEFQATAVEIGYLMAIFSLMQFLCSPFWGRLSDTIGRRPVMLISIAGVAISYLFFAYANSMMILFVARAAAGFFSANISTASAIIADITPKDKRSIGMGLIGAAFGLGFILGPTLAGLTGPIGESIGSKPPWGMQFSSVVAAGLSVINFIFAFFYLPETKAKVASEDKAFKPGFSASWKFVFAHNQLRPLILIFFLTSAAMALMEVMLFVFVKDRFGWSYKTASFGFAYVGVIMVLTQGYFIRKWVPKFGEKKLLFFGVSAMAVAFVGIGLSHSIAILAVVMTILAVGNGCMRPPIMGISSVVAKDSEQGFVMGLMQSMSAIGRIVGPPVGGLFYGAISHSAPFFASGVLCFGALGLLLLNFTKLPDPQAK